MPDMMVVLGCFKPVSCGTWLRHLCCGSEAMVSMTGRVTMRGYHAGRIKGGVIEPAPTVFLYAMSWLTLQWVRDSPSSVWTKADTILAAGDPRGGTKAGKKDLRPRSIFSRPLWQSRTGSVFSEFIPDQCQAPHVLSGPDRTS